LVALAVLRNGNTTLVTPGLEVRVGPAGPEPVSGISYTLTDLVSSGLVVLADCLEERVTGARLRDGNAIAVSKGLELGFRPAR
jgi:hypothetical protein